MSPQESALYHVLTLRPAGDLRPDGTDIFMEAMDDSQFRRDCVKQMLGDLHSGNPDLAELGRKVWERVMAYAEGCADYEDYLRDDATDTRARRAGVGA